MKKTTATTAPVSEKPISFRKYYYALGILVFFLFANTIGNGYNLDDELVTRSHQLTSRGLEATADIFTSPYYSDAMGYSYGYRPVVHLSFAIEHQFFGEKPGVSHFINVILYALSVMLFFRLLIRWAGEKGAVLALVATALFAVHPVHTEVVASIKNRDEILAFLFVVLTAISVEKFLSRHKWMALLQAFVWFSIALLSKKSVFPMAFLLPVVSILLRHITNIRQLVSISLCLLIPAALIASELRADRMALVAIAGVVFIGAAYLLHSIDYSKVRWKYVLTHYAFAVPLSIAFTAYSIYTYNLLFYILGLIALIPALPRYRYIFIVVLVAESCTVNFFMQYTDMLHIAFLVPFSMFASGIFRKDYDWKALLAACIPLICLFYFDPVRPGLLFLAYSIPILLLSNVRWYIGAGIALLCILILRTPELYRFMLLAVPVVIWLSGYSRKVSRHLGVVVCGIGLFIAFNAKHFQPVFTQSVAVESAAPAQKQKKVSDKNFLSEGRQLEIVENTLVAPHSLQETAGTGMAVLGEYIRLMIFPGELSFYYGYARTKTVGITDPLALVSLVFHLGLIALAAWQWRKRPLLGIGIAWYLMCILLFSNWAELVAGMVGERLAFTASAGFCIFVASLLLWIDPGISFRKPGPAGIVLAAMLIFFAGRTMVRNTNWKDPLTLMGHDILHLGHAAQANNLYALNLMRSSMEDPGQTREEQIDKQKRAIYHFDRALAIWPGFFNAAYDKGRAGMASGDTLAAIDGFEKAVAIGNADFTDPYYQLGDLYLSKKRNKDFLELSKKIFDISKDNPNGFSVLARGYFVNGYKDSTIMVLEKGLKKFPDNADLRKNLEMVKVN